MPLLAFGILSSQKRRNPCRTRGDQSLIYQATNAQHESEIFTSINLLVK